MFDVFFFFFFPSGGLKYLSFNTLISLISHLWEGESAKTWYFWLLIIKTIFSRNSRTVVFCVLYLNKMLLIIHPSCWFLSVMGVWAYPHLWLYFYKPCRVLLFLSHSSSSCHWSFHVELWFMMHILWHQYGCGQENGVPVPLH